jgi:hypothetical protein
MKLQIILLLLFTINYSLSAQLVFEDIENIKDNTFYVYDSASNYPILKSIKAYKGQTFFAVGNEFKTNYKFELLTALPDNEEKKAIYFAFPYEFSSHSNYDSIVGNYFYVEDVIEHNSKFYFKLKDKKRSQIVYLKYKSKLRDRDVFPFLILGFYEKERTKIDKKFSLYHITYMDNILTKENEQVGHKDFLYIHRIIIDVNSYTLYYIIVDPEDKAYKIEGFQFWKLAKKITFQEN